MTPLQILERTFRDVDSRARCRRGIYMLIRCGSVVYVGSSKDVYGRVAAHAKGRAFDRAIWRRCSTHPRYLEGALIRFLCPELNLFATGSPLCDRDELRRVGVRFASSDWMPRTKSGRRPGRMAGSVVIAGRCLPPESA